MTFELSYICPENVIEIHYVVQKIWRFFSSILTILSMSWYVSIALVLLKYEGQVRSNWPPTRRNYFQKALLGLNRVYSRHLFRAIVAPKWISLSKNVNNFLYVFHFYPALLSLCPFRTLWCPFFYKNWFVSLGSSLYFNFFIQF